MNPIRLSGLIAAPYTPFHPDFSLNLDVVPDIAAHLVHSKVKGAFIGGTTGEWASLTREERISLTDAWMKAAPPGLKVIVHVGSNCLGDSQDIAAHAEESRADCIAALMPSFFKPRTVAGVVDFCRSLAASAPRTPFYYYHIPDMTGVNIDMADLLPAAVKAIPTFAGIKFTHSNIMDYGLTLFAGADKYDILFGRDECLLAGLALGGKGAVGSTYNFAASLYLKLMALHNEGKRKEAAQQQIYIQRTIVPLLKYGPLAAGKAVMALAGIDCGPTRPPIDALSAKVVATMKKELDDLNFFSEVKK